MVMVSLNYVKSEGIMSTVSIRKTMGDDYAAIKAAVDQVIADIGGIEDIIKPGYKVIIKPNLVACPTDRLSGGVTRWEVCLAIYEAVKAPRRGACDRGVLRGRRRHGADDCQVRLSGAAR